MQPLVLYDYAASPNCLKVRALLGHLERPYRRVAVDIFGGDTLTETFAALNPVREVPVLRIGDQALVESSAILWYLAEGTRYLPRDPLARGIVLRWLLFEQHTIASGIAALRFRLATGLLRPQDPDVEVRRRAGTRALTCLETHLCAAPFLVARSFSIADLACYAYVHVAEEAGYRLADYPRVGDWLRRVEAQPGFANDLVPLPANARAGHGLSIYG